jgi:hypothetical protein
MLVSLIVSRLARGSAIVAMVMGAAIAARGPAAHAAGPTPAAARNLLLASTSHAGWTSSNWSGYAIGSSRTPDGTYTSISATWKVPTVGKNSGTRYSSQWIGIDGATNADLIQTGTEANYVHGKANYGVWWEILPAQGTTIHEPVAPGETITASIVEDRSTNKWTITISNGTWTFTKVTGYSGKCQSAEWIVEAPLVGSGTAKVTDTSMVIFSKITMNGANPHLTLADRGRMRQDGKITESPSSPSASGNAFAVAYGAKAPAPPS